MERIARSLNFELIEGATDGVVKKLRPDTAGETANRTNEAREALYGGVGGYGIVDGESEAMDVLSGVVRGT